MSKNEKITEGIVRDKLRDLGFTEQEGFVSEEQISQNSFINELLKNASKSDKGKGKGRPEFLIMKNDNKLFMVVIECKADTKDHISKEKNQHKKYAVNGVLHYAKFLSKEFNVIAVA